MWNEGQGGYGHGGQRQSDSCDLLGSEDVSGVLSVHVPATFVKYLIESRFFAAISGASLNFFGNLKT